MIENELYLTALGICNRLLNSIKNASLYALKVTAIGCFGVLVCDTLFTFIAQNAASPAIVEENPPGGEFGHAGTSGNTSKVKETCGVVDGEIVEETERPVRSATNARAPKKSVSINENVEVIVPNKKRKSMKKMGSLENEEEQLRPLKSILKVGSRLNRQM